MPERGFDSPFWAGQAVQIRGWDDTEKITKIGLLVWNPSTLAWERMTQGDLRRGQTLQFAVIDIASSGATAIVNADATRKIKVLSYDLVCTGAVTVQWKSASTALTGAMSIAANGGLVAGNGNSPGTQWLFETNVNEALNIVLGGNVQVSGRLTYFLEP